MKTNVKDMLVKFTIHLILILVGAVLLFPVVSTFFASFKTNAEILTSPEKLLPQTFSLENYRLCLSSGEFNVPKLIGNSFYVTIAQMIIEICICTFAAYAFARGEFRGKKVWHTIFMSLMFINLGSVTIYAKWDILALLHIPINLHGYVFMTLFALPVVYLRLIESYIHSLPKELDESARIDGCSFIGTGVRILFPLLKPIIATVAIMIFQTSWNSYVEPAVWTATEPAQRTLMVGLMQLKNSGNAAASWNLLLAGSMIALIPVLIMFLIGNKYILGGLTEGAVKG